MDVIWIRLLDLIPRFRFPKTFSNSVPGDSAWNHLLFSFCAGLCACLASSPVDAIRLMDQIPPFRFPKPFSNSVPGDSAWNHLLSSFCAGLCACLASSPVDVIRTRLMDQRTLLKPKKETKDAQIIYKSSFECGIATLKNEGFLALYKGFMASFMRMGPWNIIFFLVYEQLKQVSTSSTSSAFWKSAFLLSFFRLIQQKKCSCDDWWGNKHSELIWSTKVLGSL